MISFGALAAFSFVNLAVIKTYVIDGGRRGGADIAKYAVIPLLGFVFTIYLWTKLSGTAFEVGLAWLAAGFLYLLFLTRGFRKAPPELYSGAEEELTEPAAGGAQRIALFGAEQRQPDRGGRLDDRRPVVE